MEKAISSAQLVTEEAGRRGIKVTSFDDFRLGFALLELGDHQEYIFQAQSNLLGRVAARLVSDNKVFATHLLRTAGFPVPPDLLISSAAQAEAFLQTHRRVVVKPVGNTGGRGVFPGLKTLDQVAVAIREATPFNDDPLQRFVCQKHMDGRDYRVLVIDKKHIFSMERIPASVVGDGTSSIEDLIAKKNSLARPGNTISVRVDTPALLAEQGYELSTILPDTARAVLARIANAHAGGTVRDATDEVSESVRHMARTVAAHFHCPVLGIDILSSDIATDDGVIIELNAGPDLTIHHFPDEGQAHLVAPLIVDMLFPETAD